MSRKPRTPLPGPTSRGTAETTETSVTDDHVGIDKDDDWDPMDWDDFEAAPIRRGKVTGEAEEVSDLEENPFEKEGFEDKTADMGWKNFTPETEKALAGYCGADDEGAFLMRVIGIAKRFSDGVPSDDDRRFLQGFMAIAWPELEAAGFGDAPASQQENPEEFDDEWGYFVRDGDKRPSRTIAMANWHERVSGVARTARQRLHALELEEALSRHLMEGLEAGHDVSPHIAVMEKAIAIMRHPERRADDEG